MDHTRINAAERSQEKLEDGAHLQLNRLQSQLDQLRSTLMSNGAAVGSNNEDVILARLVEQILRARRRREKVFGGDLFGEPAWDILLELYAAEQTGQKLSVSSVCYASAVPQTTALRWIQRLENEGWLERKDDPFDGRRSWVQLTVKASITLRRYLAQVPIRPL